MCIVRPRPASRLILSRGASAQDERPSKSSADSIPPPDRPEAEEMIDRVGPSNVFKIPHHGSRRAFSERLWRDHIQADAVCVIIPFTKSDLPERQGLNN